MNANELLTALNDIDEQFIEDAAPAVLTVKRKNQWVKWCAAAACFCIIAAGTLVLWSTFGKKNASKMQMNDMPSEPLAGSAETAGDNGAKSEETAGETEKYFAESSSSATETNDAVVPKWDEMKIYEQFSAAVIGGAEYTSTGAVIPDAKIGSVTGQLTLTGTDGYTNQTHTIKAEAYEIAKISGLCAVALKFEGHKEYYTYVNSSYRPETLGQFIDDLNLRENLTVGTVYAAIKDGKSYNYSGLPASAVFDILFSKTDIKNVTDYDSRTFSPLLDISVDVSLLGYKNISISVTADGYLTTNIMDTGKAFYIGKDTVKKFEDYVKKNCKSTEQKVVGGALIGDSSEESDSSSTVSHSVSN